jgi:peptidoglycan/xylan/chitin deacetylase (PgdA/CDA1 family)
MYPHKTPAIIKPLMHQFLWNMPRTEKAVYLTFDDGPHPEITPQVLHTLQQYNARATFFCVGANVEKHPDVYRQILDNGHTTGNHTWNHCNGWRTPAFAYLRSAQQCAGVVDSGLFRPPYGRITRAQARALSSRYRLVMWDVLSGDFDRKKTADECRQAVVRHTEAGSIIVFHDSEKAAPRMLPALEASLQELSDRGFRFLALPQHNT